MPGMVARSRAHIARVNFCDAALYSDARSAQIVDDRIRPALEAGGHIKKKKPYLVVIDEIDGATGGTENVRVLRLCVVLDS